MIAHRRPCAAPSGDSRFLGHRRRWIPAAGADRTDRRRARTARAARPGAPGRHRARPGRGAARTQRFMRSRPSSIRPRPRPPGARRAADLAAACIAPDPFVQRNGALDGGFRHPRRGAGPCATIAAARRLPALTCAWSVRLQRHARMPAPASAVRRERRHRCAGTDGVWRALGRRIFLESAPSGRRPRRHRCHKSATTSTISSSVRCQAERKVLGRGEVIGLPLLTWTSSGQGDALDDVPRERVLAALRRERDPPWNDSTSLRSRGEGLGSSPRRPRMPVEGRRPPAG